MIAVLLLIIIAVVTIFSVQNASPVAVSFLLWKFEASLAIVIFLSVFSGILIAWLVMFSGKFKQLAKKLKASETASTTD
ncbi:MAG: DUF1049 domain-containing protein [Nitrospirae bacterium CG_4_10_14_3_um_filter_44_29]|nr:MAG: DUF1049 domain-containing protein [Nitrospirae bacterium CG02_land_8_20_14_3_00_44_33]PIV67008.1 MAG: DUF1049 domain-containing protein [Nitrospirae bacterium CG01_land_8_20_14_3_00_44_22]PIW88523.1 MAG: DUF1049 domain-containing protein [Nitrospirae bacterium CG_4_8_14_3_um_filter_44_28]PIX87687.1 MAG: DUF1049 domain-containing protein [Nitrospirae bacterium CG_4_10_14_3_um_filter_44_29]